MERHLYETGELEYVKPKRPQSATSKAVEKKVFSLHVGIPEAEESSGGDESSSDDDENDPLNNYLTYEDEDFDVSQMGSKRFTASLLSLVAINKALSL